MLYRIHKLAFPLLFLAACEQTPAPEAPAPAPVPAPAPAAPERPALTEGLPIVGVLVYPKVLGTEVAAPIDVFAKHAEDGSKLFNVITIAQVDGTITTEEGLRIVPDYTFADAPELDVLVVPSAYDMHSIRQEEPLIRFIQEQDRHTDYTMSNCAGAQLIGAAGIADGRKIVTWIGGGEELKQLYPKLDVQDDATVAYVEDGKFLSSNGNLASYISALELLEKMTTPEHRAFIEGYLYLERLQGWGRQP